MKSFDVETLSHLLGGLIIGGSSVKITEPEQIEVAKETSITFIGKKKYLHKWEQSKASVAIISKSLSKEAIPGENRAFIVVNNPDIAMAKLLKLFAPKPLDLGIGVHPSAVVSESSVIGECSVIGANCYIGAKVKIGREVIIQPNVTILDDSSIGDYTIIKSGTVISERCTIGMHCILYSGVNIGTDGFGYRPSEDGKRLIKMPHIGTVVIGDYVEIGSGTCIDRGKFSSTVVGNGTKIDNLVQIAHNCQVGRMCIILACTALAGSVSVGHGTSIGGQVGVIDHITIGSEVRIVSMSFVIKDIPNGKTFSGIPATDARQTLRKWAVLNKLSKK